jgi:hypothetical protein
VCRNSDPLPPSSLASSPAAPTAAAASSSGLIWNDVSASLRHKNKESRT